MMARLLALAVTAALLMPHPGQLAYASRTSPSAGEAFWRAALPDAPVPDAILDLLHHETDVRNRVTDDDKPPMNFNYDDYRASHRSEAAATTAPSPDVLLRAAAAVRNDETVFFLEDAVRVGESLPLRSSAPRATATAAASAGEASAKLPLELYTVRSVRAVEGSSFVVCRGAEARRAAVYGCRATGQARAYVLALACERGDAVVTAAAVCRTDTSQWDSDHAAFRLLGVKPGGAAVCHAVPDALVLTAKNGKSPAAN